MIASKDVSSHLQTIRNVFWKLLASGLKLAPEKCHFANYETRYLGHIVTEHGIKPDPKKVLALQTMKRPNNAKEVEKFCGFANYLSRYIKNFAEILQPLFELKSSKMFTWSEECETAFTTIIHYLTEDTMLRYPRYSEEFCLDVDASEKAVGAMLYQEEGPIAFYSRTLNRAERNYATTDREFLALVEAVDHFRYYLLSHKFRAFTDHKALINMVKNPPLTSRHARYITNLEEYNFDLLYKRGEENVAADTISRLVGANIETVDNLDYLVGEQRKDEYLVKIIDKIEQGTNISGFNLDEYNVLCYHGKTVVPEGLVRGIIEMYHSSGHFGEEKVRQAILGTGYWFKKCILKS